MINELICPVTKLLNEDGTEFNPPVNPLREKWDRLYPPMKNCEPCDIVLGYQENGTPYMNYGCVLCYEEKCPYSEGWKVPEEDLDTYELWQKEVYEYHKIHNPNLIRNIEETLTELMRQEKEK